MASSPPAPYSATLPNPKKRPSIAHAATTQPDSKRPKLHPLRQTSFPVNGEAPRMQPRSAVSETGSVANSHASGYSAKTGKKLGRPRKDRQSTQLNEDDLAASQAQLDGASTARGSTAGGRRGGTKSVVSGAADDGDDDDDDKEDLEGMLGTVEDQERRAEEHKREQQKVDRLVGTFNHDQERRYTLWRAVKLNKAVLRRMVNQTVSQSVGANPLLAVMLYSKYFVGEIVERAREVQAEWADAYDQTRRVNEKLMRQELEQLLAHAERGTGTPAEQRARSREIGNLRKQVHDYTPNPHRGGLMPDHLREALRRYKSEGEGGGVAFAGHSHGLLGVKGAGAFRVGQGSGGKRLFK